jgi:hypothetical protein
MKLDNEELMPGQIVFWNRPGSNGDTIREVTVVEINEHIKGAKVMPGKYWVAVTQLTRHDPNAMAEIMAMVTSLTDNQHQLLVAKLKAIYPTI